jgi:hypothetical protein
MTENSFNGVVVRKPDPIAQEAVGQVIAPNDPEANDQGVIGLLVDLGSIILKKDRQEWMGVEELCELTKENGIKFQGHQAKREEVEKGLKTVFGDREEVYNNGVNVVFSERRVKWDLVPQVRCYKYNPNCNIKDSAVLKDSLTPETNN